MTASDQTPRSPGVPATSEVAGEADISDGMSEVGGISDLYPVRLSGPNLAKEATFGALRQMPQVASLT